MWQVIWSIAPDLIAVALLIIKLTKISSPTDKAFSESVVKLVIEKFNVHSVNVDTASSTISMIDNLMELERLRDATVTASLISLAGTLALLSDPSFGTKGKLLCLLWFVLFGITQLTKNPDTEDRREHRRRKILWCTIFLVYILISVAAKVMA